ncbi:MAG: N-formylglutamate amidohydrolase [Proteobacteria bacterium]|jgi:N-formylglutamate amidohydrolase|nr:MAG: N-formylglutamate amidohydrolase [Pseudomonadota bacterium]
MPQRERACILAELTPPYVVIEPVEQTSPFVFCSPHSGNIYPTVFLERSRLDAHTLRKSEDCFVDELFGDVASLGAPLIAARFPRAYLDVNREPYELDPELFDEPLPAFANTQTMRVAGGLGTLARIVADGEEIYREPLPLGVAMERIERLYKPFHARIAELLERTHRRFGVAILVDCHSMPSASMNHVSGGRPDFVIGDRFGASCDAKVTRLFREIITHCGYQVQLNRPYAGGFITEHYGRPFKGIHALQIEINRGLYLNETKLTRTAGFDRLKRNLTQIMARIFAELPPILAPRAAAE